MYPIHTRIVAAVSLALCATLSHAADIQIKMSDKSQTDGVLAFDPGFVKANVNDTLVFIPAGAGHNTRSLLTPSGAESWKSPYDKEFRVKLDKEGVYLYACEAHKRMGMVGVVQVGNPINLEEAKAKAAEESASMVLNKDRFTKALGQVQ
ncbi:MAG: pseudoazurin [Nitrosomonadales bacterium]|nr:pseudoazurin [Nitrosomonadales bacterium]